MKRWYAKVARLINTLSFPVKGLFIHNSKRVRVIIISEKHILLTKSAIGSQKWSLPGGGIEKGEAYTTACKREVLEETGLSISTPLTQLGYTRLPVNKRWPVATIHFFSTTLQQLPTPHIRRPLEILDVEWFLLSDLPQDISPTVAAGLKLLDRSYF